MSKFTKKSISSLIQNKIGRPESEITSHKLFVGQLPAKFLPRGGMSFLSLSLKM